MVRTKAAGKSLTKYATIYTIGYSKRVDSQSILDPNFQGGKYSGYTFEANIPSEHYSSGYYYTTTSAMNETFKNLFAEVTTKNRSFRFTSRNKQLVIILDIVKLDKHFIYYLIELLETIKKYLDKI